jgi:tight adherence protein B
MKPIVLVGIVAFLILVLVIELVAYALRVVRGSEQEKLQRRLKKIAVRESPAGIPDIVMKKELSSVPLLHRLLSRTPGVERLDRLIQQADVDYTPSVFVLLSLVLGLAGYLACVLLGSAGPVAVAIGACALLSPLFYLRYRKKKRMARFQAQLPEALELIARALRAGHAFTSGLKLVVDQFEDPLGTEFGQALREINFGVNVHEALKDLAARVDCPDIKFFVVSVILQRETGGNLAEIIENIARIVRERFKFEDRVQVLAAEGKLSARILIAIPVLIAIALHFLNPDYIHTLFSDQTGRIMVGVALAMMAAGILFIRRMIDIKV